jgi:hypothetical protein
VTYSDLLINTCTIRRFTEGAADSYGHPVKTWAAVPALTDIACRYSEPKNNEIKVGAEVLIYDLDLFMNDVDITVQDRVVLSSETYEILGVKDRQNGTGVHHKELAIRTIR